MDIVPPAVKWFHFDRKEPLMPERPSYRDLVKLLQQAPPWQALAPDERYRRWRLQVEEVLQRVPQVG